jgi:hypothetical protein
MLIEVQSQGSERKKKTLVIETLMKIANPIHSLVKNRE